jgi:hypothetical protein
MPHWITGSRHFEGTFCLYLQGATGPGEMSGSDYTVAQRHVPEEGNTLVHRYAKT